MTKKIIFAILILGISVLACKKVKDLFRFNINLSSEIAIPATFTPNQIFEVFGQDVSTNNSETFKNNGTEANLVKEIKLTKCNLTITSPSSRNFDFLKSIEIYIADSNGNNSVKIASKSDIPETAGKNIELDVEKDVLLDKYLKTDKFKISSKVVLRNSTTTETKIKTDLTFNVLADPL